MSQKRIHEDVHSRNEPFVEKTSTKIWYEEASDDNPYLTENVKCHGYDLLELAKKRSFVDTLFLLFKGELPTKSEAKALETLMILLINPGPRHEATRAAMNVGVGKTEAVHILPIASSVLGGKYLGAGLAEESMRFIRKSQKKNPESFARELIGKMLEEEKNTEEYNSFDFFSKNAPGFGSINGGIDPLSRNMAEALFTAASEGRALNWAREFTNVLNLNGAGWLSTGLAAAVFADLGFQPRLGGPLFQLLGAPGLIAHGIELANKPITSMPYVKDEDYVIKR